MQNPYETLPDTAYWKTGVAAVHPMDISGLYKKKITLGPDSKIATAGSCFAQHITRFLKANGFGLLDVEPAPAGLAIAHHQKFGFSTYSARYGNIYTARQLLQLAQQAFDPDPLKGLENASIWEKDGRFYDAFRPSVEPDGQASRSDVISSRQAHLQRVRDLFLSMDVFVFTLGLTETWRHRETGFVFPTAPGVIAAPSAPADFEFLNLGFADVLADIEGFITLVSQHRGGKGFEILLTVSPVPLTATASGQHVLAATMQSKAILRAAAGELYNRHSFVDYFPSFEIINNPWNGSLYYERNLRSVSPHGVAAVMKCFFDQHRFGPQTDAPWREVNHGLLAINEAEYYEPMEGATPSSTERGAAVDVQCEEELLNAFTK